MAGIRLQKIDGWFKEDMKNPEFRRLYEIERAKVAIAQKIAEFRDENHLNQKALAARLGVSQQFVSQLENAEGRNFTLVTLARVAGALGRKVRISFLKSDRRGAGLEVI